MRKSLINPFRTVYKLRTLKKGALVREWPRSYSLYIEDPKAPESDGGYRLIQSTSEEPSEIEIEDLFAADELITKGLPPKEKNIAEKAMLEVFGFFQGLSKL